MGIKSVNSDLLRAASLCLVGQQIKEGNRKMCRIAFETFENCYLSDGDEGV